jgi:hypothetical protein
MLDRLATLAEVGNAAAFLAPDRASAMTATLANVTCGAFLDEQAMAGSGPWTTVHPVASLERPCTPVERPTVNKPQPPRWRHQQKQLLVMDRGSVGAKAAAAADDGSASCHRDRHGGHAMQQGPSPRHQTAPARRRWRWVTSRQRRRPPSPIERRTPAGRLLPY